MPISLTPFTTCPTCYAWEDVNDPLLRGMLADFDKKWGHKSTCRLLVAYEDALGPV